jgi:hypothetical protein
MLLLIVYFALLFVRIDHFTYGIEIYNQPNAQFLFIQ